MELTCGAIEGSISRLVTCATWPCIWLCHFIRHKNASSKSPRPLLRDGGFLVSYVNYIRQSMTQQEQNKGGSEEEVRQRVSARLKDLCAQNIFGIDINPFLGAGTCQMNMVMHGDGSANVFKPD